MCHATKISPCNFTFSTLYRPSLFCACSPWQSVAKETVNIATEVIQHNKAIVQVRITILHKTPVSTESTPPNKGICTKEVCSNSCFQSSYLLTMSITLVCNCHTMACVYSWSQTTQNWLFSVTIVRYCNKSIIVHKSSKYFRKNVNQTTESCILKSVFDLQADMSKKPTLYW